MRKTLRLLILVLVLLVLARVFWPATLDLGNPQYFTDQTYNFETIRVLDDIAVAGGDNNEAAQAVRGIKVGDADGWYTAWKAAGDRATALAMQTQDHISKGNALLRAHTYYRSAEFFLAPTDNRRAAIWKQNVDSFYIGLDTLGVKHERISVPYGDQHHLNAVYYPGPAGSENRPLLVAMTGYDGTMEELYASVVVSALQHGYSVLTFEGPGQGSVLRDQHLTFQPDWEKPNGAVLDVFLASHPKPAHIVEIGESMGGYLAPRAAAFDSRIDGVVAYDVFYDGYAIATRRVPHFVFWLRDHGYNRTLNFLSQHSTPDPGSQWAQANGEWVLGAADPFELMDAFKAYRLSPVAGQIKSDVLILAGADDHFVPPDQLELFRRSLTHARSVTAIEFDRLTGGAQHCQLGAPSVWHAALFDWLQAKFP